MSFWDNVKETLGRVFTSGAPKVLENVSQAVPLVGLASAGTQLALSTEKGQELAKTTADAGLKGLQKLDEEIYKPYSRFATAAALTLNQDTINAVGKGKPLKEYWDFAYKQAERVGENPITPAQAALDLLGSGMPSLFGYDPNINIYDEKARVEEYKNNFVGQTLSGAGDLAFQIFADPFAVAGKAAKIGRLAILDPAAKVTDVIGDVDLPTFQAKASESLKAQEKLNRILDEEAALQNQIATYQVQIDELTKQQVGLNYVTNSQQTGRSTQVVGTTGFPEDVAGINKRVEKISLQRAKLYDELTSAQERAYLARQEAEAARVAAAPTLAKNLDHFFTQIIDNSLTANELVNHRVVQAAADPGKVASVLELAGRTKDKSLLADAWLAMTNLDPQAMGRLEQRDFLTAAAISREKGKLNPITVIDDAAKEGIWPEQVYARPENAEYLSKEFDALINENQFLQAAIGKYARDPQGKIVMLEPGVQSQLVAGRGPSKVNKVERARFNRARRKANYRLSTDTSAAIKGIMANEYNWIPYRANAAQRLVYVAEYLGVRAGLELPTNMIPVRGLETFDGSAEVTAYLNSVPVLNEAVTRKSAKQLRKSGTAADDVILKQNYLNQYLLAKTADERIRVLTQLDTDMKRATFARYGIDPAAKRAQAELARKSGDESAAKRLYKEADDIDAYITELIQKMMLKKESFRNQYRAQGYLADAEGNLLHNPVYWAQIDNTYQLTDMVEFDRFVRENSKYFDEQIALSKVARSAWDFVKYGYGEFDQMWRPAVLMRLGYPQRNVAAEALKIQAAIPGGLAAVWGPRAVPAINRWIKNTFAFEAALQARAIQKKALGEPFYARVDIRRMTDFFNDQLTIAKQSVENIEINLDEAVNDVARAEWKKSLDAAKAQVDDITAKADEFSQLVERQKQTIGKKSEITISGQNFPDSFYGADGRAFEASISSAGRSSVDFSPLAGFEKLSGQRATKTWDVIDPGDPNYFAALSRDVAQMQFSPVARMFVEGSTYDDVVDYLYSQAGQEELKTIRNTSIPSYVPSRLRKSELEYLKEATRNPEEYAAFVESTVDRYLPTEELRQFIASKWAKNESPSAVELAGRLPLKDAQGNWVAQPIHGELLKETDSLLRTVIKGRGSMSREQYQQLKGELLDSGSSVFLGATAGAFVGGPVGTIAGALIGARWNQVREFMFKYLSKLPEDAFISRPLGDHMYQTKLALGVEQLQAKGIDKIDAKILMDLQRTARQSAAKDMRQMLYRVIRRNNIAQNAVIFAPFAMAQAHTVKAWARIAWEQPDRLAVLFKGYSSMFRDDVSERDENGQSVMMFRIPGFVTESRWLPQAYRDALKGQGDWQVPVTAFNLIFPGIRGTDIATQFVQSIGISPILGAATTAILTDTDIGWVGPDIDQQLSEKVGFPVPVRAVLETIVPPESISDRTWAEQLLPATLMRIRSLYKGTGAEESIDPNAGYDAPSEWTRTLNYYYAYFDAMSRVGDPDAPKTEQEKWKRAKAAATAFGGVRLMANATLPAIPRYQGVLSPYMKEYQRLQAENPFTAFDLFHEKYPEFASIAAATVVNITGVAKTTDAVYMQKRHNTLIQNLMASETFREEPDLVAMITNREYKDLRYDQYANKYFNDLGYVVKPGPEANIRRNKIRTGWEEYRDYVKVLESRVPEGKTLSSQPALVAAKKQYVESQRQLNPYWFEAQRKWDEGGWEKPVQFLTELLKDKKWVEDQPEDSWVWTAQKWLDYRNNVIAPALMFRKSNGGSSDIDSASNADIRRSVELTTMAMSELDPVFGDYYKRYFDYDKYLPVKEPAK